MKCFFMENTTRLLLRHQATLHRHQVLIVGCDDVAQKQLAENITLHSDDYLVIGSDSSMLPVLSSNTDLVVVVLPKSREQLAFWLSSLAGQITAPIEVWLVGPTKGGIRGGVTTLTEYAGDIVQVDSARHCKVFSARLRAAPFESLASLRQWQVGDLEVFSFPGVFSHGRADPATDLLLGVLVQQSLVGEALDIGCGAGVIAATLARRGLSVTAVDVSATAVASTAETLSRNGLSAKVLRSDVFDQVKGKFDLLITNPPFHEGTRRTIAVTERLIAQAPEYLKPRGGLWMVANQGLPYGDMLKKAFKKVDVVGENRHFRVWRAQ